jgi:arylsulfatase
MYDDVEVPDPVGFDGELDHKPPPQRAAMAGMEGKHTPAAVWWSRATPQRIRRMRKHYYANVTLMDDWVGKMVATMEQRGQLDNTVVVFTSDHGDCLGDHHQVYKFYSHYDSVARVPLVFAGPGVQQLGVCEALMEAIDLGPTFLELAGLAPLAGASGRSLQPLLTGQDTVLHECVFSEHGARIMARTNDWKLVSLPW